MAEHRVGSLHDFEEGDKRLVALDGVEIGIFNLDGTFYAWRNVCPHQGGPVCQGRVFSRVVGNLDVSGELKGLLYDEHARHIVCPWHGAEFDIRTGHHAATDSLSLDPIPTVVRDGEVFLDVD